MKIFFAILLVGLTTIVFGQAPKEQGFDSVDFNKKMEIAEWLYKYDMIAWQTSDSVLRQDKRDLERLGGEWFCLEKEDIWHAVYGKYQDNVFDQVFHFKVDRTGKVSKTTEIVDTTLTHRYSRALQQALAQMKGHNNGLNLKFNQYIRENADQTISVWILPAFQPNHTAIFGGEFSYTFDPSGTKILKDDSYFKGQFKGFKVDRPREIGLDYPELEKPTLGAIFFAWYYKSYFTKIVIENAENSSILQKTNSGWEWTHGPEGAESE
ncbi:hypothetical protein BWD42_07650 [Sphingobacterium sp. CZ-UAM]|uniref:hypothetical protein n=1 Tax=Sphingobacterium sp. CZ-UAM TaxID=1933868 RepID=UPI0009845EC0|nr:hypothetical protein [Sphingobacterium sp. CZ-UAM]OOG19765.1 hypothetical protein BWD42_07650 [Sphingobacterium sp. CZ-UAM]